MCRLRNFCANGYFCARPVGVYSLRYGRVPEHLLDYLGVRALTEKDRGARVTEVVEPYPGEPGALQERPEGAVGEVGHVHGRTDGGGENEVVLPPEGAGGEPLLQPGSKRPKTDVFRGPSGAKASTRGVFNRLRSSRKPQALCSA